jgi:hypothetical protein
LPHDFYPVIPTVGDEEEPYQKTRPRQPQGKYPTLQQRSRETIGDKQLLKMEKATAPSGTPGTPVTLENVEVGMKVEHPRFGIGEVILMEGSAPNTKATVQFPIGKTQLLL